MSTAALDSYTRCLIEQRNEAAENDHNFTWTERYEGRMRAFELALAMLYAVTDGQFGVNYLDRANSPARLGRAMGPVSPTA